MSPKKKDADDTERFRAVRCCPGRRFHQSHTGEARSQLAGGGDIVPAIALLGGLLLWTAFPVPGAENWQKALVQGVAVFRVDGIDRRVFMRTNRV